MFAMLALLVTSGVVEADEYVFLGTGTLGPVTGSGPYTPVDQYWLHRFSDTTLQDCSSYGRYTNDWSSEYNEDYDNILQQDRVWPHALWYSSDLDMMFSALIYSNKKTYSALNAIPDPGGGTSVSGPIGSIGIYDAPTALTDATVPDRELFGLPTGLDMPHSIAVDALSDLLYVANTQNGSNAGEVLVWTNASTVDGFTAPAYTLSHGLSHPVDVHYDASTDTLSVVDFSPGSQPEVWIYESVSADLTSAGASEPDIRFTFADITSAHFIHETWYWGDQDQLYFTTRGRFLHRFDTSIYHGYPTTTCNGTVNTGCPYDPDGTNQCTYLVLFGYAYLRCSDFELPNTVEMTLSATGLGGFGLQVDEVNDVLWTVLSDNDGTGDELLLRYDTASALDSTYTPTIEVCWDESDSSGNFYNTQGLWVVTD